MAFGPELLVVRNTLVEGKASQVQLGEFDTDRFPPVASNDPMSRFVDSVLLRRLSTRDSTSRFFNGRIADQINILWGVIEEDQPLGFATLTLDQQDRGFCDYTIVLHPSARHRGLGGLATAGVIRAGLEYGLLHDTSDQFDRDIWGIGTAIHPENVASQKMCERAGFELVEDEYDMISGLAFPKYVCEQPAELPDIAVFPL